MLSTASVGQIKYKLNIINTDSETIFKKISYKKEFQSLNLLNKELNTIYLSLLNEGFITASIDSLTHDSLNYTAFLVCGKKYTWVNLSYNKNQQEVITKLGYNEHFLANAPLNTVS